MTVTVEGARSFQFVGSATVVEEGRELAWAAPHIRRAPDVKWILGNYVQTATEESPTFNSNGHYFPYQDMRDSIQDIPHRPLNLNHLPNRRLGTFVAAEFVWPEGESASGAGSPPIVEALAAFWAYYEPEIWPSIEMAYKEGQLFFCVDEETELLTAEGWKSRADLGIGEDILTLNTKTGLSEWTPLVRVNTYKLDGEDVVSMESTTHSSVTTPNHRWWVERRAHRTRNEGSTWEWRTTETLTQETWIPRAVPHAGFPKRPEYDDSFVELAAWFWTEGTLCKSGGSVIYQSHAKNPQFCDRIAAALTRLYGPAGRVRDGGLWYSTDHGRMRYFHLCTAATEPFLSVGGKTPKPGFIRALTESQLRLWVTTSLDGDGDHAASGQQGIKQNSLLAQRTFEMACALLGIPTNTRLCKDGQWRVGIIQRSTRINPIRNAQARGYRRRSEGMTITRRPHDGVVWCPTTPNGTFLARRNGSVYWTGNSMESVPETITCKGKGDNPGCDKEFAYDGRTSPTYCDHLNQVAARKILHKPHFTAGALILPPVRPGWKAADIKEISQLLESREQEAERAYEEISQMAPHLGAESWERITAFLLASS